MVLDNSNCVSDYANFPLVGLSYLIIAQKHYVIVSVPLTSPRAWTIMNFLEKKVVFLKKNITFGPVSK